ncbi:MAG: hypothetical protein GPJ54_01465 [Candidatus Heimdallarchaeota archaeon]|nr:hypothetical protein [Candidatus Heimdallarchaeota archaeon]
MIVLSPLTTGNRVTLDHGFWNIYASPNEDLILVVSFDKAIIYNLDLEKQGEFIDEEFNYDAIGFRNSVPTWSQDQKYIILDNEYYVYYLNSNDLSIQYKLHKFDDLNVSRTEARYQGHYIDPQNNLHYLRNNSLVRINPQTSVVNTVADLSYNNLTFIEALFHQNGQYVALFENQGDGVNLVILDLISNTYSPIEQYVIGGIYFAPSKPYLAFRTMITGLDPTLTIYDLETNTYATPFIFNIRISQFNLVWSHDSAEILEISPNSSEGGYERAYTDNVIKYDVVSGKKNFNFKFSRGLIYESDPVSYTWLSNSDKIVIVDWTGIGSPKLVLQDIGENAITIYSIAGYALFLFGVTSSLLLLSIYFYKKPAIYNFLTRKTNNATNSQEISDVIYEDFIVQGFAFLTLYYILASILNGNMRITGYNPEQIPVTTADILFFSFLSMLDISIIVIIMLLRGNKIKHKTAGSNIEQSAGVLLILGILIARYIQGYSYGLIHPHLTNILNYVLPLIIFVFIFWIMKIVFNSRLFSTDTKNIIAGFPMVFFLIYTFTLFISLH